MRAKETKREAREREQRQREYAERNRVLRIERADNEVRALRGQIERREAELVEMRAKLVTAEHEARSARMGS